jgi:hypothetical protein
MCTAPIAFLEAMKASYTVRFENMGGYLRQINLCTYMSCVTAKVKLIIIML